MNKNIIAGVISGVFIILIIVGYLKIKLLDYENNALHAQLTQLANESKIKNQQYQEAHAEAEKSIKQSQQKINELLDAKIPKDCQSAISWGIQQAKGFKE